MESPTYNCNMSISLAECVAETFKPQKNFRLLLKEWFTKSNVKPFFTVVLVHCRVRLVPRGRPIKSLWSRSPVIYRRVAGTEHLLANPISAFARIRWWIEFATEWLGPFFNLAACALRPLIFPVRTTPCQRVKAVAGVARIASIVFEV